MNTYLIIDTDKSLSKEIEGVLSDYSNFYSLGHYSTYDEAMNIILKRKPDIVFFNIDNVIDNCFEFVKELHSYLEIIPDFVAISKTKVLAYEALKNNFIDYLINPLSELEIRKLCLKYKKKQTQEKNTTLCLKSYKDYQYINTDQILFLKADNNTTNFHFSDGSIISAYKTLKIFENALPSNFLRIHKSYIVNKDYVRRINYGKLKCTVSNELEKLPFTKTYIDNIELINQYLTNLSIAN